MPVYVDTSVYLNLWKKETSQTGAPFWKIAEEFFHRVECQGLLLFFLGFILKELSCVAPDTYASKRHIFNDHIRFVRISVTEEDYHNARALEDSARFLISFSDCMHIVLAARTGSLLVTRDRKMIHFAQRYCAVSLPEDALQ